MINAKSSPYTLVTIFAMAVIFAMTPTAFAQNSTTTPVKSEKSAAAPKGKSTTKDTSSDAAISEKKAVNETAPADSKPQNSPTEAAKTEEAATKDAPETAKSSDDQSSENQSSPPETSSQASEEANAAAKTDVPAAAEATSPESATAVAPAKSSDSDATKKETDKKSETDNAATASVQEKTVAIKKATAVPEDTLTDKQKKAEAGRHMFVVTYNLARPLGKTAKYIDKFSFEGFSFEYRFMLNKQLSVGLGFNWNTFETKKTGLVQLDKNTRINGTRILMDDLIQLTPTVQYHFFKQSAKVVPFAGLSVGPYYTSQVVDWGWWYQREAKWQFGFTPEVGLRVASLPVPLYLSVRYTYTFKTDEIDAQQAMGINIGVAFLK
ncbi:MAG: hypothetical protein JXR76_12105 [Deltaproteobacteria bacterium]|nr:hypothetical protein [Deltaproteobacteria bacterium]